MKARGTRGATISDIATFFIAVAALCVAGAIVHREFFADDVEPGDTGTQSITLGNEWEQLLGGPARRGAAGPIVTIVEFIDYQCPACKRFESVIAGILDEFGSEVAVVYRALPLEGIHPLAYTAAKGAHCATLQGRFESFHHLLLEQQSSLATKSQTDFAAEAGFPDLSEFRECVSGADRLGPIEADLRIAAALNLSSTPTIAVNGTLFRRLPDSTSLRRIVLDQLRLVRRGE